jgi:hypothetical protein
MKLIIMAPTVDLYLRQGLAHELRDMELGSSAVVAKLTYLLIEFKN